MDFHFGIELRIVGNQGAETDRELKRHSGRVTETIYSNFLFVYGVITCIGIRMELGLIDPLNWSSGNSLICLIIHTVSSWYCDDSSFM
jgi:hypothetical protein